MLFPSFPHGNFPSVQDPVPSYSQELPEFSLDM